LLEFSIWGDRTRSWTASAFLPVLIQNFATYIAAAFFFLQRQLDQYTLTVMIHGALLVTASQMLHLLKFQRRTLHRRVYCLNTALLFLSFMASYYFGFQSGAEENLCPALSEAIAVEKYHRAKSTIFTLVLSALLSVIDVVVSWVDYVRNKNINRKNGDHSRPTFPKWLVWNPKDAWTFRRVVYCLIAVGWFTFSIFNVEYFIIRDFHNFANKDTDGAVTNNENRWAIGQVVAFIVAAGASAYCNYAFFWAKLVLYASQEKGISPRPSSK
jgi:hypothetical protein